MFNYTIVVSRRYEKLDDQILIYCYLIYAKSIELDFSCKVSHKKSSYQPENIVLINIDTADTVGLYWHNLIKHRWSNIVIKNAFRYEVWYPTVYNTNLKRNIFKN